MELMEKSAIPITKEMMIKTTALLVGISKQQSEFHINKVVTESSPYRGNISGVLLNMNLIKQVRKGIYTKGDFIVNDSLAEKVILQCRVLTNKIPDESKPNTEPVKQGTIVVNPFGFASFDSILVEQGKIFIGDYVLEGSFTITKKVD